nr:MAG TPA: hypothetical protein [Caudoviricetes sp.]
MNKVIEIALAEVGYKGKKSNSQLDNKTANTSGKYNKYARDLDNIAGFYNGKKNGYDWCDIFVDWCFVQAFGVDKALELLCQPKKSTGAGCSFSMNFYKKKGRLFNAPQVGDQIFFGKSGDIYHTGLVYKVENGRVYTIEGNSGNSEVAKWDYPIGADYIAGYGRPAYNEEIKPIPEPTPEPDYTGIITYQAYTDQWLPEVNKCYNTADGYAGIYGRPISGFRCIPENGDIIYEAHIKGGNWLGAVNSKDYKKNDKNNPNSYAGLYGKTIDGIRIKSTKGYVDYRVHTIEDGWLPWARGFGENGNEYGGIYGHTIDGIQMK